MILDVYARHTYGLFLAVYADIFITARGTTLLHKTDFYNERNAIIIYVVYRLHAKTR